MKPLNCIFVLLFLFATTSFAQSQKDPASWKYEVKKKSSIEYQLVFHLSLEKGWFIWALKPGGDGLIVAPGFAFDKNELVKMKGTVTEKGKKVSCIMAGIKGEVNYFTGKVDYLQDVIVTGKTKITGKHEYQVCNDRTAIPPKYKNFVFEIK